MVAVLAGCVSSPSRRATTRAVPKAPAPSAKIVNYGRYTSTVVDDTPAADLSGEISLHSNAPTVVETTTVIPAKVGEEFGICVLFCDLPKDRGCIVRKEMQHPPIPQPNGKMLTTSVEEFRFEAGFVPETCAFFGWCFLKGYESELVPGTWTCTIYVDGKKVASKAFAVKAPETIERN